MNVDAITYAAVLFQTLCASEAFLSKGPQWWFSFHVVPDLAETVLPGHEAPYLAWFFTSGAWQGRGIDPRARDAFVQAYTGADALRCGFGYYRALGTNATQVTEAVAGGGSPSPP